MYIYILRRLLLMIPTLIGITIVVFTVMAASPGGISAQSLVEGQNLKPQEKKAMEDYYNRRYGLDKPPPIQYLRWLNNISPVGFTFDDKNELDGFSFSKGSDLGTSFRYGRPVGELLKERVPITLLLNVITTPIIYIIAIAIGVRAATQRGKSFDVGSGVAMLGLWSAPTMLVGVLLIGFFASSQHWQWFPTANLSSSTASTMPFLPHWSHTLDVVKLFLMITAGIVAFTVLSQWGSRNLRGGIMGVIGVIAGVAMANALPYDATYTVAPLLAVALGALFAGIGMLDYVLLRVVTMSLIGAFAGAILTPYFTDGEFTRGFLVDRLWHLTLPIICLSYGGFAFLAKLTRTAILENLLADYARTARAKGVPENHVLWRHVFRNSLLPLITVSATLLPSLLGGAVIVETLFSIDGMGKLAVDAVKTRDRELVLSITFISGVLTLLSYLIADLCYAIADPRVSYE